MNSFTPEYIAAVIKKLEKRGYTDEQIEKEINIIVGVEEVKTAWCDSCDSKGVRHKKDCPKSK